MTAGAVTRLHFIRHGDVWNPDRIFYGRLPRYRLSPVGLEQARAAAARLAGVPLVALYSSPLLRARQTAETIRQAHPELALRLSTLLLEIRSSRQGEHHDALEADGWNFYEPARHPDDETIDAIARRVARFCRRVVAAHPDGAVAAVTHGDILATAAAMFSGRPLTLASLRGAWYPPTAGFIAVDLHPNLTAGPLETWSPAAP